MYSIFLMLGTLFAVEKGYWDLPENDPLPREEIAPEGEESPPLLPEKELLEVEALWGKGDYQRSVAKCQELIKKDPKNPLLYYRLGEGERRLGHLEEAKIHLEKALSLKPNYLDAQIALGFTELGLGDLEKAKALFYNVLEKIPSHVDAAYGLSLVEIREGKREEAYDRLSAVLRAAPDYTDALKARAEIDLYFNRFQKGYEQYQSLAKQSPSRELTAKLYEIRKSFRPMEEGDYTASQEEEEDLITHIKTTRILTKSFGNALFLPLWPKITLIQSFRWYQETQQNLVAKVNNYNIDAYLFSLGIEWRLADNWNLTAQTGGKLGRNEGKSAFVFRKKNLWESSIAVRFTPEKHFATVGATQESFIARDFKQIQSFFVRINPALFGSYEYRFAPLSGMGAFYWNGWYQGDRPNQKQATRTFINYRLPKLSPNIIVGYRGEYSFFDQVDPDYYSYKKRIEQEINLEYVKLYPGVRLSLGLSGGWERVMDFTNVADLLIPGSPPPQILKKNIFHFFQFNGSVIQSVGEHFEWEGKFSFYHNTNQYNGILGSLYLRLLF